MDLPIRIVGADDTLTEPVISVDGAWDAPGLNLSHWPGNRTPDALRHDLSTGSALAFARLAAEERERLAAGAVAIVNNHVDTDGTCALFAVRHPELALPRSERLLAAAAAGDFFQFPDDHALALDAIVGAAFDRERTPWPAHDALDERARHEAVTHELLAVLPHLLDGALEPYESVWTPILDAAHADRDDLGRATRDDLVHLDLCVWTSGEPSSRAGARGAFDPGRHALFGGTDLDRILVVGAPDEDGPRRGTTFRLLLSTLSWFDLVTRETLPRPDLAALAARLNELEGTADGDRGEAAWRAQPVDGPSPELWFGTANHTFFGEHAPVLRPSALEPAAVKREVFDALRAVLAVG